MTEMVRTLETLELVGGALCLDFVNTVNSRLDLEHDYLTRYSDLVGWAEKLGILAAAQGKHLRSQSNSDSEGTASALLAARTLRDRLYRMFSKAARGSEPDKKDMDSLVTFYGESIARSHFLKKDGRYTTTWNVDRELDALLLPVVHSAGELLQSEELAQVKECPGCGWLFLDTSKNQSRRWCSMNTCGARDKMRRYHSRKRL